MNRTKTMGYPIRGMTVFHYLFYLVVNMVISVLQYHHSRLSD